MESGLAVPISPSVLYIALTELKLIHVCSKKKYLQSKYLVTITTDLQSYLMYSIYFHKNIPTQCIAL